MRRAERIVAGAALLALAACTAQPPQRPAPPPSPVPKPLPAPPADVGSIPDAVPKPELRSRSGNPPFYVVNGRRYFVLDTSAGYAERGVASWYGPDFHGERTAMGETYDMYAMTAAHTTLPLPCHVQVTNLANGKSVVVRVNDRGPFVANRIIDLSYAAAIKLDMVRAGTALVEVRTVSASTQPPSAATSQLDRLYVQAGAFADKQNAEQLLARMRAAGVGPAFVRSDQRAGQTLYRVRVGPVPSVAEFDRVIEELRAIGVADARLALD